MYLSLTHCYKVCATCRLEEDDDEEDEPIMGDQLAETFLQVGLYDTQ